MASKDLMLDIETLSTHPSEALILSIGTVPFEITDAGPTFGEPLIVVPDMKEQLLLGRRVDRKTQVWWGNQPGVASDHWLHPQQLTDVRSALALLTIELQKGLGYKRIWANGIVFDIGNVDNLYRSLGLEPPWPYNAARDARTVYDNQVCPRKDTPAIPLPGANLGPHNPIYDCYQQIVGLWGHGYRTEVDPPQGETNTAPAMPAPATAEQG